MAVEKSYPNAKPAARLSGHRHSSSWLLWIGVCVLSIILGFLGTRIFDLPPRVAPLLLAAILFPFVAMIAGNLRMLLLVTIILETPLGLEANLGYREDIANLGALGGLNISVTTIALIGLYVLWLSDLLTRRGYRSHPWFRSSLIPVLFLVFIALSSLVAQDVSLSIFTIALILQSFLLFVYMVGTIKTREEVMVIVAALLVMLLAESLIMVALYFVRHDINFAGIRMRVDYDPQGSGSAYRVGGSVGSPNTAAGFISMLLPIALGVLLTRLGRGYKLLAACGFGVGVVALTLTFSRGGWIAALVSTAILCSFALRRGWLSIKVPLIIALMLALLAVLFPQAILGRLFSDDAGSALSRVPLMELAWRIINANPLLGVGTNNFAIAMKEFITPEFSHDWIYTVHNRYLLTWAEAGIGAIAAFVAFLMMIFYRGWQVWKQHDRLFSPLALGMIAAVGGHMYQMTVEAFNGRPAQQLLFLLAGLVTVIYCLGHSDSVKTKTLPSSNS